MGLGTVRYGLPGGLSLGLIQSLGEASGHIGGLKMAT